MTTQSLRSVLYMPGSNQRAMDKARELAADAVIFDLEDAVAPEAKAAARQQVIAQVAAGGYGARKLVVRANSIDSPWGAEDLAQLAAAGVPAINLPKIESAQQLQRCLALLRANGAPEELELWAMIETPQGVANVNAIAAACPELKALVMGTNDLAYELRVPVRPDRLGLLYALSRCVNAARVANIMALDTVFMDITDAAGLQADCELGRALGFDGRTLIHPSQIDVANAVYGVSEAQVLQAQRVIATWEEAIAQDKGVAVLDGKLVETMHVDDARRVLALAESVGSGL